MSKENPAQCEKFWLHGWQRRFWASGRLVDTHALCIHQPSLSPSFPSRQTGLPCTGPQEQGTWMLCDCSWITMSQWMTKTVYEGKSPLRVLQMCSVLGEHWGLGAGPAVTDFNLALGGWHKALQCLESCGLPAQAGAVPIWSRPCFQMCLCSVFCPFPCMHSD